MSYSKIAIWLKQQRELGLSTKKIEKKFNKLVKS